MDHGVDTSTRCKYATRHEHMVPPSPCKAAVKSPLIRSSMATISTADPYVFWYIAWFVASLAPRTVLPDSSVHVKQGYAPGGCVPSNVIAFLEELVNYVGSEEPVYTSNLGVG